MYLMKDDINKKNVGDNDCNHSIVIGHSIFDSFHKVIGS